MKGRRLEEERKPLKKRKDKRTNKGKVRKMKV
jgi:hypothetical protein